MEAAAALQPSVQSLREALEQVGAVVRQADGHHIDRGPNTVPVRQAARRLADAADAAVTALAGLDEALTGLVDAAGGDSRG